jgi:hypothetical protein
MEKFGLLALDLATRTGFALERRDGQPPLLGSALMSGGMHPGRKGADYIDWLGSFIKVNRPERIIYEAPFMSADVKDKDGRPIGNAKTLEWLVGIAFVTDILAYRFSVPVSKLATQSARRLFTGSGRSDKDVVMAECRRRGWNPQDKDAADAACLLDAGISLYFPKRYKRSYPGIRAA